MKIIENDFKSIKPVIIQVKDLLYLSKVKQNNRFRAKYEEFNKVGKKDTDFVRITDQELIKCILLDDTIVNFVDYINLPSTFIITEIIERTLCILDEEKEKVTHRTDDLRDIIAYKRGNLGYEIPIIPTTNLSLENNEYKFSSTIFNNIYLFTKTDNSIISGNNYDEYLLECILSTYAIDYPGYTKDELSYSIKRYQNGLIIAIRPLVKKSIIDRFKTKRKLNKEMNSTRTF